MTFPLDRFALIRLRAGRQAIARRRLQREEPQPLRCRTRSGWTVIVHRSTRKHGWWQASFFDRDGEPFGDSECETWAGLLEHISDEGIDWKSVERVGRQKRSA